MGAIRSKDIKLTPEQKERMARLSEESDRRIKAVMLIANMAEEVERIDGC